MKNEYEIRGDITAIFLNSSKYGRMETLIDTKDLPIAQEFPNTWYAAWDPSTQSFYCVGNLRLSNDKRTSTNLHRWLTKCPKDKQIDHYNHDTLDNRRDHNLRIVTGSQNKQNMIGAYINSKSNIRGVSWHKQREKWKAQIQLNGKSKYLGIFTDIEEAEKAVIAARKKFMPYA